MKYHIGQTSWRIQTSGIHSGAKQVYFHRQKSTVLMTFIRALLFSLALFPCTELVAQFYLTGQIMDESRETLIGASVKVVQNGQFIRGGITDFDGNFKIPLAPGSYAIEISYTGFKTKTISGIEIGADQPVSLGKIEMEASIMGCWCCFIYVPPLIDMSPGNTGLIIRSDEIRRRY